MANLLELAAQIEADRARFAALAGPINSARGQAEIVAGAIERLGLPRSAGHARRAVGQVEEAQSILAALDGTLVKAHWAVMSAVHGNIGPGARGSGPGGAIVKDDGTIITKDGQSVLAHLDAVPRHLREDPKPTGEELAGADPTIGPFQKEHEGANDDRSKSRAQRFSRKLVRNVEDIAAASKDTAKTTYGSMTSGYEPPKNPQVYETIGVADPPSAIIGPQPAPKAAVEDTVASMVVMAVVAVEGLSRLIKSRGSSSGRLFAVQEGSSSGCDR